jgi:transposase
MTTLTPDDGQNVVADDPTRLLFGIGPDEPTPPSSTSRATPRLRRAQRDQVVLRPLSLDALLPEPHQARVVWEFVQGLDLTSLYQRIAAVQGRPGRTPGDPQILLALWLFATVEGVGSARALDRLCREHVAYQWLAGDVPMNYHTLSDFRTDHPELLDELLTQSVATLLTEELVDLNRVAQDGMRVRASAGAASFRRQPTLERCLTEAQEQVTRLRAELETGPAQGQAQVQAAQQRAARERVERVQRALQRLPELAARKKSAERDQARASTTDPDATVMKMADGGFRPAYNVQFATDTDSKVIVGVDVITSGSDAGQLAPMVEQIQQRHEQVPQTMLVDGGFVKHEDIEALSQPAVATTVYAPVPKSRNPTVDEHAPHRRDTPAVTAWRQRMATAAAQEIYKERAATAELINAQARNRGLQQFRVRGLAKVRMIALWYALAHNLLRTATLRAAAQAEAAAEG